MINAKIDELISKMGGQHPLNKTVSIGKNFTKQDLIDELESMKIKKLNINDKIEEWHKLPPKDCFPIQTYLGMTWGEYARWVRDGEIPARLQDVYIDE